MTTDVELARRQLAGIEAFNTARRQAELAARAVERTREMRMDNNRRLEVLRREHLALIARAQEQLRDSGHLLRTTAPVRAVISHRQPWFVDRVRLRLEELRVVVIDQVDNGADAIGIAIAEQPDLMLLEERLLMVPGDEVVRDVRRFSPATRIGVQVSESERVGPLLEAGAHCVTTRVIPPADVVDRLLATL
jgi:hypothetical protein